MVEAPTDALERLDLFAGCAAGDRARAARLLHPVVFEAGEEVLRAGGEARLVIVLRGRLRVRLPSGVEGTLGAGDIVGEIALLDGVAITATVSAVQRTDVLVASAAEFARLRRIGDVGRRLRAVADARRDVAGRSVVAASTVPVFSRPPRVMGRGAGLVARAERRHRPVRSVLAGVVVLVAVAAGGFLVVGNTSTPVGLDAALARLSAPAPGSANAAPTVVVSPVPTSSAPRSPAPASPEPSPAASDAGPASSRSGGAPSPPAVTAPQDGEAAPASSPAAPAPGPDEASPFRRPQEGVYAYATTGGERISVPNGEHRYPDETYGVVRLGGGCRWELEHLVLEEHTEHHERCSEHGRVLSFVDGRRVSFFGKAQENTYRCDPPAVLLESGSAIGSTGGATCRGDDGEQATYRGTYLGRERVTVGGTPVAVEHLRIDVELTGRTQGTSTIELWLHADSGLPVREERTTRADVDSELGQVRYEEDATFELRSLTPQR